MKLEDILNYYAVDERIASSGQPGRGQFDAIAAAGYQAVINLARHDSPGALADEGAVVTALGLDYFHQPVDFEAPRMRDLELFFDLMQTLGRRRVWVHCALNYRVSCFLYLYRRHVQGMAEEQAARPLQAIWRPEGAWQELIAAAARRYGDGLSRV